MVKTGNVCDAAFRGCRTGMAFMLVWELRNWLAGAPFIVKNEVSMNNIDSLHILLKFNQTTTYVPTYLLYHEALLGFQAI